MTLFADRFIFGYLGITRDYKGTSEVKSQTYFSDMPLGRPVKLSIQKLEYYRNIRKIEKSYTCFIEN